MLVSEIALRVKRVFGDEAGAQITDADIMRWINDAQRDIAVNNNLLQVVAESTLTSGSTEASMPANMLTIRNIYWNKQKLKPVSYEDATEQSLEESEERGTPTTYWVFANKIQIYPSPDVAGNLKVYYTRQPVEVTAVGNTPELPQQYHNRIVEYCLAQAYELDDNWESYKQKMQMFQDGMDRLKGHEDWQGQDVYPSITASSSDYGNDWGGYYA